MRDTPRITLPLTPSEAWKPPLGGDLLLRYYVYGLRLSFFRIFPHPLTDTRVWTLINELAVVTQSPLLYDTSDLTRCPDLTRC